MKRDLTKFMVQVLFKMRIKWSTVHAQFSQFNSRPNARGGYDWKFNKEEWVNTLKVLNMGLSEAWLAQTFEALDDGSGWVEFPQVQEVFMCPLLFVRYCFFLFLCLGASALSYKVSSRSCMVCIVGIMRRRRPRRKW
jgi:hypothetical protein